MAEIRSPLSGGLRVARRTVSADAFVSAAPPPPPPAQPDPVTTTLIQRNSLALNTVSQQLSTLTQQVNSLNVAMQNVYGNVTQSSALERRQDAQEQEQERRLAEQQLREGKESIIERKIQSALVAPVQKVASKASFTLSRLMQFFTTLLGGWLLQQGIETIKALGEGNRQRLEEIRNSVIKNLGIIGGVYAGIRFGLTSVFNVLTRVAARVTSAVAVGLFLRPVQALLDGVKGAANRIIPKIKNILPGFSRPGSGGNPPPAATTPATQGTNQPAPNLNQASKQSSQTGLNRFAPTSLLQGALTGGILGGTIDTMQGEDPARAYSSNVAGGATSAAAANLAMKFAPGLLKIPAGLAAGFFSYGPATDMFKGFYDKTTEMFGGASGGPGVDKDLLSQPTQSMVTDIAFGSNAENLVDTSKQTSDIATQSENIDFTKPAQYGEINVSQLMGIEGINLTDVFSSTSLKTPIADITPIKQEAKMKADGVGPLPEPAPNIIPLPMGGGQVAQSQGVRDTGPANNVPSIDPENPNNFYVVYSHSVYNVPMM
jgi:hypothetical protein